ncbi:transposable element Tcb1 transposase [Trichonephila clavipes]|nr:transposable element Tcb1 transposase [Trichonephila clavipes]
MHRHTGPAPSIVERDWISLSYPSVLIATTTNIQCYICEVLSPQSSPYIQCLPSAIFQLQSARPHVERNVQEFFFAHPIELLPWPACFSDLSPIENEWFMGEQRLDRYTPSV